MAVPPIETVWLTHLKVSGLKPGGGSKQSAKESTSYLPREDATITHLKPYERLTADKPGEELAPDAGIWQLYVQEASDHDTELVKEKNENLDVMLLFAALFSAILTTLLIESKNLLQEDSGDVTVTLLLAIAQSQQRVEQGSPQNLPPVERPPFSVPPSALWINGLWFTSLFLSVGAALIAMLAKEWLSAFTASRSRSARAYAHLHQARLNGMIKWRALHIIDLLPSLLHLSLLLFSLGLCIYLWTIHTSIAVAPVIIAAAALASYMGTIISAAIYPSCPYVTQLSKYLKALLQLVRPGQTLQPRFGNADNDDHSVKSSNNDLEALSWLAENAQDPVVSDCACQALAGLQVPQDAKDKKSASRLSLKSTQPNMLNRFMKLFRRATPNRKLKRDTKFRAMARSLFDHTCNRLREANIRQQRDLKACQGINVARYSGALPALVHYLETNDWDGANIDRSSRSAGQDIPNSPAQQALDAIDSIWSNDCPEFSSDAYALLTAAEFRLTEIVVSIYHTKPELPQDISHPKPLSQSSKSPAETSSDKDQPLELRSLANQGPVETIIFGKELSLLELRARYSRALFRSGVLLTLHNNGRTRITPHRLVFLLDSLRLAAQSANLNPMSRLSTTLPQPSNVDILPEFRVALANTGTNRYIPPNDLGDEDGLLSNFVKLMSSASIEAMPEVEMSVVWALESIGPTLVTQWLNMMNEFSIDVSNKETLQRVISIWPKQVSLDQRVDLAGWSLSQLLCVTTVALSQIDILHMADLTETAVAALYRRATMESGQGMICWMAIENLELFHTFVQMVDCSVSKLPSETLRKCLGIFLIESFEDSILREGGMTPPSLKTLIHLLAKIPGHLSEVQFILGDLRHLLPLDFVSPTSRSSYLGEFMHRSETMEALVAVARIPEYTPLVLDLIASILELAVKRSSESPDDASAQLAKDGIPGFLAVVHLVMCNRPSDTEQAAYIVPFIQNVITMLGRASTETLAFATSHPNLLLVDEEMTSAFESRLMSEESNAGWDEIRSWVPVDGWHLGGLSGLFDSR